MRRDASLAMRSLKQQFDQLQLRYKDAANALKRQNTSATADSTKRSDSLRASSGGSLANGAAANVSNGRAVVVRLAEAEAKVDQLTRALAKKGAYLEAKLRAEKERSAKQFANLKAQLGARRRRLRGSVADSLDGGGDSEGGDDEGEPMATKRERERLAAALQASESERRRLEHDLEYAVGALEEFKYRAAQQQEEQQQDPETGEAQQEQPPTTTQVESSPPSATGVQESTSAATIAATVAKAVAAAREEERAAGLAAQKSLEAVVVALRGGMNSGGANAVKVWSRLEISAVCC